MKLAETQPSADRAPNVRICCKFCCKSMVQVNPFFFIGSSVQVVDAEQESCTYPSTKQRFCAGSAII